MNNTIISIHDKKFTPLISEQEINEKIRVIAHQINNLCLQDIVLVSVLNGAFMFTAELCKHIDSFPIISFIKVASYQGTESTGNITQLIGLQENIEGKTVIIIEDIIDTGTTIDTIYNKCKEKGAKEIYIAALVFKPNAYKGKAAIQFTGFTIPNNFVVGYGMDYNGIGRNLKEIYVLQTH